MCMQERCGGSSSELIFSVLLQSIVFNTKVLRYLFTEWPAKDIWQWLMLSNAVTARRTP